jgi:hypothetical protein
VLSWGERDELGGWGVHLFHSISSEEVDRLCHPDQDEQTGGDGSPIPHENVEDASTWGIEAPLLHPDHKDANDEHAKGKGASFLHKHVEPRRPGNAE